MQPLKVEINQSQHGGEDCRDAQVPSGNPGACAILASVNKGVKLGLKPP